MCEALLNLAMIARWYFHAQMEKCAPKDQLARNDSKGDGLPLCPELALLGLQVSWVNQDPR